MDLTFKSVKHLVQILRETDVELWFKSLDSMDAYLVESCEIPRSMHDLWVWETTLKASSVDVRLVHSVNVVLQEVWGDWFSLSQAADFRRLHQVFSFAKKLSLQLSALECAAKDQWWRIENGCFAPRPSLDVMARVKTVIDGWFPKTLRDEFEKEFTPRHGPGSVAEGCKTKDEKFLALSFSQRQLYWLNHAKHWERMAQGLMQQPYLYEVRGAANETCKQVFVNKSWKTYRTISMEPVTTQWLQQGACRGLDCLIRRRRTGLSQYYMIDSEETNRWLCEVGSVDGSYATIDMSAASDCVLWPVVKYLFRDTCLWHAIFATRSTYVEIDGDLIAQTKFAPMGSRFCFPIETIVHAAAVEAARLDSYKTDTRRSKYWPVGAVFGDDIVCQDILVEPVMSILEGLGLVVNSHKSFWRKAGHLFRESCGAEYLDGYDVAPIRLSREFPGFGGSVSVVPNLVQLSNMLFDRALNTTRTCVIDHILSVCPFILWDDGTNGIKTVLPYDSKRPSRWNADLQCTQYLETRVQRVREEPVRWSSGGHRQLLRPWTDAARLFEWLRIHPTRSVDRFGNPIPKRWPEEDLSLDTEVYTTNRYETRTRYFTR
jgi:hypothetical protein